MENPEHYDVAVIGAGAAGLTAAFTAAERGRRTLLLEKNARPGVKIHMSGGTRCNITQNTDVRGIIDAYGDQGRFLHSALAGLSPRDVVQMFEAEGVATKIEDTNKIFPVSDKASDVLDALTQRLTRSGAKLALQAPVARIERTEEKRFQILIPQQTITSESVIITTGGLSYPGSGTCGDGYPWAAALGHTIVPTRPALTPLTTNADWVRELSGLTIPDVGVRVVPSPREPEQPVPDNAVRKAKGRKKGVLIEQRGSFLFTHFGLSGPSILDVSRAVTSHPHPASLDLVCDFLPELNAVQLEERIRAEFATDGKRQVLGIVARLIPRRLAEALFRELKLDPETRGAEFSKKQIALLVQAVKEMRIPISGALGYKKAEVTAGGVSLDEVDSKTMQSKIVPGLFFAGEVLDVDGPIGGYNFQAAFATGRLAGCHA